MDSVTDTDGRGLTASPHTEELLVERRGRLGRLVLNRPRAINALTLPMVQAISAELDRWADDDGIDVVSIEGAGERGLCAGGDVVAARAVSIEGTGDPTAFFVAEYAMNARLAQYDKPIVALMDGVVMGGGIGVSGFSAHRLVTDRSKVAMPETGIGFFPDVGALFLLAHGAGELGTHLAMTGATVSGPDAIAAGLADRLVDEAAWPALLDELARGDVDAVERLGDVAPQSGLADARSWIDQCYAGDDPVAIAERLASHPEPAAREAEALLRSRSPLSVAITLAALRRAAGMTSVQQVLNQDLTLAGHLVAEGDFAEGVRAQLVDKDRSPHWQHERLEDVPDQAVQAAFTHD